MTTATGRLTTVRAVAIATLGVGGGVGGCTDDPPVVGSVQGLLGQPTGDFPATTNG